MREGGKKLIALLIFPRPMMPELELAPALRSKLNRLPWCLRASPSTTLHETVISTDADRLMLKPKIVNVFFAPLLLSASGG